MRTLIIFICVMMIMIPSLAMAQEGIVVIDSLGVILPVLMEFRNDARKHRVYVADAILSKNLGGIEIVSPKQIKRLANDNIVPLGMVKMMNHIGLYNYNYSAPTIYIQDKLLQEPEHLRYVIYHELGHVLGLKHSEGIMSEYWSINNEIEDWYKLLVEYFNKIRALPNNSYMKRYDNTHIPE